ncbi:Helix-loop-helix DNA-binding domain protein [Ancylostoma caninum]|uniref:Helix-loop-helix DNA-binding domain protein n=1 Tax=Ancylostoma caninum TaxID=29170 RepID=A0A368GE23_ANCCA|nr:Helix-loop-helix DNA-binding domain protein [Ancylostoma caninum]
MHNCFDRFMNETLQILQENQAGDAFAELRQMIPSYPPNKRLSKLEILHDAMQYITILEQIHQSGW